MSRDNRLQEYEFTLLLMNIDDSADEAANKLFEAGGDDATLSFRSGRPHLTFSRAAESLRDAVVGAIQCVGKAGYDVLRVNQCDLVTQADIARRIGRTRQLINQYVAGTRGPGRFPSPMCNITEDHPLWSWCEVAWWLYDNDLIPQDMVQEANDVAAINALLGLRFHQRRTPELLKELQSTLAEDLRDAACSP